MTKAAVMRTLAEHNGGPGLTLDELIAATRSDRASVRSAIAALTHDDHAVTCVRDPGPNGEPGGAKATTARYRIGDPAPLLLAG